MAEIPTEARMFKGATRERVRRALATLIEPVLRDDKKAVSVARLRGAGSGDQNATTTMLRLWRAGMLSIAEPWDDPAPVAAPPSAPSTGDGADLGELIQAAQTHDDLLAAGKAVALRVLDGMDPDMAGKLTQLLTEMRQSVKGRALEPKDLVESVLPCTEEAQPLIEAFEGITDDERRAGVLTFAQEQLEVDRLARPSVDTGGAAGAPA